VAPHRDRIHARDRKPAAGRAVYVGASFGDGPAGGGRLNAVASDQSSGAEIGLIVVTDDRLHARDVVAGLDRQRYQYSIVELTNRASVFSDFDTVAAEARGKRPLIVLLDCAFLRGQAEAFAARIVGLQHTMAIECVATRLPPESHRRTLLGMLGVSLFGARTAEIIRIH